MDTNTGYPESSERALNESGRVSPETTRDGAAVVNILSDRQLQHQALKRQALTRTAQVRLKRIDARRREDTWISSEPELKGSDSELELDVEAEAARRIAAKPIGGQGRPFTTGQYEIKKIIREGGKTSRK